MQRTRGNAEGMSRICRVSKGDMGNAEDKGDKGVVLAAMKCPGLVWS